MTITTLSTYTVSYESANHWSVLTQTRGSILQKVLPYCIFNVAFMMFLIELDDRYLKGSWRIEVSDLGHNFITLIVSFLLVNRISMALSRYNTARDCLDTMYRSSRELVQKLCIYTSDSVDEQSREWRHEVAYRTLLMLRTAMAVVDYDDERLPAWKVPELRGFEREDVTNHILLNRNLSQLAHASRSQWEETMRVPVRLAYLCRKSLYSNRTRLQTKSFQNYEFRVFGSVDSFMEGFYGITKFLTTPVPFPLIQMSRAFVFLYVFTVPFVFLEDKSSNFANCLAIFLLTYGFLGLELVAIEMDNPFGADANDFDNIAMAKTAYEDIYLTILDIDGLEWANKLRKLMTPDDSSNNNTADERTNILSKAA